MIIVIILTITSSGLFHIVNEAFKIQNDPIVKPEKGKYR